MDEIDAALDFRNVSIVANYIKDRTKNAQFIIISLRFVGHYLMSDRIPNLIIFDFLETTCLNSVIASSESTRPPMLLEVRVQSLCDFSRTES